MGRMGIPIFQVDAFAAAPFTGNPAAVCLLESPADAGWIQRVAAEMNLSETAFLVPRAPMGQPPEGFDLRWFTPVAEVALCGHATLASAHVLWEEGRIGRNVDARFLTQSGWLTATRRDDRIALDFPALSTERCDAPAGLAESLGVSPRYVARTPTDYLVEVERETIVRDLRPDFARLRTLPVRGVMVTSRSDDPAVDFVSRFFGPAVGVDEDPVTGSAHCALGPYWSAVLGKSRMSARQLSRRGGAIDVEVHGDRVHLVGRAEMIVKGELLVSRLTGS